MKTRTDKMFIVDNLRYQRHGYHCWRLNERQEQKSPSSTALTDTYWVKDGPSPVLTNQQLLLILLHKTKGKKTNNPIEHHSRDNRFFWSQIHRLLWIWIRHDHIAMHRLYIDQRWREKQLNDLHCWSSHHIRSSNSKLFNVCHMDINKLIDHSIS